MLKLLEALKLTRQGKLCPSLPLLVSGLALQDWKIWVAGLSLFIFQEVISSKVPDLDKEVRKELDEMRSYLNALGVSNGIKRTRL